ncbi:MAG TPA: ATP-dependent acyl-CoA ligase [Acetobacteraceae bacterium]|nr:ATP-dependent acyl-CoA ligase [Acetobacteraceae bacterium]
MRDGAVSVPPAERTLPRMLARRADADPDRPLVAFGDVRWTLTDTRTIAAGMGSVLRGAGVARGERVAILCGNRPEFLRVFLGCAWIGAIAVPINAASRGKQLAHILADCGARLLAVDAALAPALATVEDAHAVRQVWLIGGEADVPAGFGAVTLLPPAGDAAMPEAVQPGDPVAVLYTSGTTGPSKGVLCPHAQYFWWAANTARLLGITAEDRLLTTLPLFHTNALNTFYQALLTGAPLAVEPRFSASGFAPALARADATVTFLLGAMVPILLSRPPSPADRGHRVRIALAPGVPARFHSPFTERFGIGLLDGYGSTETNFALGCPIDQQRPGLMGPAFDGFEAMVADDHDNALPDGVPGELLLRAREPFAFASGYLGRPEQTVAAWRNLWFHTGDRVVREADGFYRFVDRIKDAIRRRGENVSAFEVEQVLLAHPDVANAAVYAVPSELAEDEVMAAIVPHEGAAAAPEAIAAWCRPRLPGFAVPRFIAVLRELPMTENGKVEKYRLRARGVSPGDWDATARPAAPPAAPVP